MATNASSIIKCALFILTIGIKYFRVGYYFCPKEDDGEVYVTLGEGF